MLRVRSASQALAIAVLLGLSSATHADDVAQRAARGRVILAEKCGRCHAIDAVGESPLRSAPPMREIYARFHPRELRAELTQGMVSRHKDMPQIEFSDEDVDGILVYLYTLAVRK